MNLEQTTNETVTFTEWLEALDTLGPSLSTCGVPWVEGYIEGRTPREAFQEYASNR